MCCVFLLLPSKLQKPESIPGLYPSRPQLLLSKVHTCCRPPPILAHTCSNTQNKQADSTQPSTFCDIFTGLVCLWRGGGKILIAAESAAFNHLTDASAHAVHYCLDMRNLANLPLGGGRYAIKVLLELSGIGADYVPNSPERLAVKRFLQFYNVAPLQEFFTHSGSLSCEMSHFAFAHGQ